MKHRLHAGAKKNHHPGEIPGPGLNRNESRDLA